MVDQSISWPRGKKVLVGIGGIGLGYLVFVTLLGQYLVHVNRDPEPAGVYDVGVVLYGGSGNEPFVDQESQRRCEYGLSLFEIGRIGTLVCLGGYRPSRETSGAEVMADYIRGKRDDVDVREIESQSNDTVSNLKEMFEELEGHSLVLLTSRYHRPRVMWELRRIGPMGTEVKVLGYDERRVKPRKGMWEKFLQIQHELASWSLRSVLPDEYFSGLVRVIRR